MVPVKRCDGVCIIYLHSTARLPICVPNIGRRRVIEEGKLIRDEAVERPHSFALGIRMDDSSLPPKRPPRPRLGLRAQGFAVLLFHAVVVTKRNPTIRHPLLQHFSSSFRCVRSSSFNRLCAEHRVEVHG